MNDPTETEQVVQAAADATLPEAAEVMEQAAEAVDQEGSGKKGKKKDKKKGKKKDKKKDKKKGKKKKGKKK